MTFPLEHLALTDSETLEKVLECLAENSSIETQGGCDQETLFEILVKAASSRDSLRTQLKFSKISVQQMILDII